MTWDGKDLAHVLPSYAVYFVLTKALNEEQLLSILERLRATAGQADTDATPVEHWEALRARMDGRSRWDMVAPRYRGETATVEGWRKLAATAQSVENVLRLRRYTGYTIRGIRYTVDLFNPANELAIPYAGAGEPVLALLFEGTEPLSVRYPRVVRDCLVENTDFYKVLKAVDQVVTPEYVCGTYSMMSVLWAYLEGRVKRELRPWEFLYPLHVLRDPPIPISANTRFSGHAVGTVHGKDTQLARVEPFSRSRVLIQVRPGLESNVSWEYFAVAKALGMVPVQQLV